MIILNIQLLNSLKLKLTFCLMIFQENSLKDECSWTTTKNRENFLNSKMMLYGNYLKNLRKSMIIIKMSLIRKQEMK